MRHEFSAGESATRLRREGSPARAFSLIELLTVILIIFVVLALIIPALDGARNVARSAATRTVMKEFGNAVDQFRQDHDQAMPGVYSPEEMGDPENASTYGYTTMENALLSLAGGARNFNVAGGATIPEGWEPFGPSSSAENDEFYANPELIGANVEGNPGYWAPPERFIETQQRGPSGSGQFASDGVSGSTANIPDVVDAWGNPIMLWAENPFGPRQIDDIDDFALRDNTAGDGPARFYWAANAGHLKADTLGRGGEDQTEDSDRSNYSLLGEGADEIQITMTGLLGSPAFPDTSADLSGSQDPFDLLPGDSRGRMVMHSTGLDGVYLGTEESGATRFEAAANGLPYGGNFFSEGGDRWVSDGSPTTRDVIGPFDDMFQTFGN